MTASNPLVDWLSVWSSSLDTTTKMMSAILGAPAPKPAAAWPSFGLPGMGGMTAHNPWTSWWQNNNPWAAFGASTPGLSMFGIPAHVMPWAQGAMTLGRMPAWSGTLPWGWPGQSGNPFASAASPMGQWGMLGLAPNWPQLMGWSNAMMPNWGLTGAIPGLSAAGLTPQSPALPWPWNMFTQPAPQPAPAAAWFGGTQGGQGRADGFGPGDPFGLSQMMKSWMAMMPDAAKSGASRPSAPEPKAEPVFPWMTWWK